ncbi:fractalkine isoform X1 [Sorex araneus]|uniref:fractalkine isoform X1 n=1 Tax=Sorex araneus TaxID=42254 RepID=UPI00243365F6|nr:fractalkine isoform X1 [Sorex araneus]
MAPSPLSWLLRLAALCHLPALLAGQHLGVKKCSIICNRMTSEIPSELLIGYQRSQESCGKRAIILETKKHKLLCADPTERWVQRAMERLDHQAAALMPNGGTFQKQIGLGELGTTLAARGTPGSAAAEPKGPGDDRGQEGHVGASPPLPTRAADSWETRPPSAAQGPAGGAFAGPARTQLPGHAALTTTAASQPGPGVWAEGKASADTRSQAPPSQAPPTPTPATPAPPHPGPPHPGLPHPDPAHPDPRSPGHPHPDPRSPGHPHPDPRSPGPPHPDPRSPGHAHPEPLSPAPHDCPHSPRGQLRANRPDSGGSGPLAGRLPRAPGGGPHLGSPRRFPGARRHTPRLGGPHPRRVGPQPGARGLGQLGPQGRGARARHGGPPAAGRAHDARP